MAGGRTRTPTYNCTVCPSKYLSQSGVDAHVEKEHGPNSAPTKPTETSPSNQPYSTLNNYSTGGRRQKIPDYKCPQCPSRYLSVMGVENHIVKEHSSATSKSIVPPPTPQENTYVPRRRTPDYKCPHCPSRYLAQSGVDQHVLKEHANPDGTLKPLESNNPPPTTSYVPRKRSSTFNCPHCISKYLTQSGVDAHILKEHSEKLPSESSGKPANTTTPKTSNTYTPRRRTSTFNCQQCPSKYLTQNGLDKHMEKDHLPAQEEETNNEEGLSWPPEKGSMIATLFEDNFYIGRVLRIGNDNSAKVRYMERYKKNPKSKSEDQYWIWPDDHETFQTAEESVLGTNLIIEKDLKSSTQNDTVFELKDYDTWSNLANNSKGED